MNISKSWSVGHLSIEVHFDSNFNNDFYQICEAPVFSQIFSSEKVISALKFGV